MSERITRRLSEIDLEASNDGGTSANSQQKSGKDSGETSRVLNVTRNNILETTKSARQFMADFDPETSARERRKLNRKLNNPGRKYTNAVYDEKGIHIKSGKDLCDCLKEKCPGCFFPCPKCRSFKCGNECRVLRKYVYDVIDYDGSDQRIKNPYSIQK